MFETTLKKFTVITALIWRLGILVAILIFNHIGGFSKPEAWQLVDMVLPVSCLYITASFIFIARNSYVIRSKRVDRKDAFWGLFIHLIYALELTVLLCKAFWGLPTPSLLQIMLIAECICAVYGAVYLSKLEKPAQIKEEK